MGAEIRDFKRDVGNTAPDVTSSISDWIKFYES